MGLSDCRVEAYPTSKRQGASTSNQLGLVPGEEEDQAPGLSVREDRDQRLSLGRERQVTGDACGRIELPRGASLRSRS